MSSLWRRHKMGTFSASLILCAGNSPVTGEFPMQRPVTRSFDVFFDLHLNQRLSKQSRRRWFETPSCPLWRHCNSSWLLLKAWCRFGTRPPRTITIPLRTRHMPIMLHNNVRIFTARASPSRPSKNASIISIIDSLCFFVKRIQIKFMSWSFRMKFRSFECHITSMFLCRQFFMPLIGTIWRQDSTSFTIVYSTVYSGTDERKHKSPASLAFVRGIHRSPVNSPHKGPVTRKMFPFDDVIMTRPCVRRSTLATAFVIQWTSNAEQTPTVFFSSCI